MLFSQKAQTKYRLVPEWPRALPNFVIPDELWARLVMPVALAFFYRSGTGNTPVGLYPSAAGALQAELDLEAWAELEASSPSLREMAPDVEALLVNRLADPPVHLVAPIDRCYELVGLLRLGWKGLSGGTAIWRQVGEFLDGLAAEARP